MSFHSVPSVSGAVLFPIVALFAPVHAEARTVTDLQPTASAASMRELINAMHVQGAHVTAPDPLWAVELTQSAERIRALREGWDGDGSVAISEAVIHRATLLVRDALIGRPDPAAPYLVPVGDGSLQIEWHRKHAELEFCLGPDGSFDIWGRDHRNGAEFEGEGKSALALFYRWAPGTAERPHDAANVPPTTSSPYIEFAA